jgi:tetratricopeptide (TPR) repeat protein
MITAHDHLRRCVELSRRHGFGRIEVANLAQIAHTRLYFRPQQDALEHALAAAAAAAKVGHHRAELNARLAATFALFALVDLKACREQAAKVQTLVHRLDARRFEAICRVYLARIALAEGRQTEAIELLRQALEISRQIGIGFHGPQIFAALARALDPPEERRRILAEGEVVIRAGCVGHNQLRFYPDAMQVALDLADYDEVERYAMALEDYTLPEPLPWSEFFIARGRTLAAFGRGQRDAALAAELRRLCDEGERLGLRIALPAIEATRAI